MRDKATEQDYPRYFVFLGYAYLFIYYVRPQENVPGLDLVPWVGVLFLIFTMLCILNFKKKVFNTPLIYIFLLSILFGLTSIGAISVVSYKIAFKWISQVFPQCVGLYLIFANRKRLEKFLHWWCVIFFFMAIATLRNAPFGAGDFSADPNDAALALSFGIPFAYFGIFDSSKTLRVRWFYILTVALLVAAVIATGSRGGFLGLVAVFGVIWWFSRSRIKILSYAAVGTLLLGSALLTVLPEHYLNEILSISDTKNDTRVERIWTWEIGWLAFKDKPLLGIGVGNFRHTAHLYQEKTSWWTGGQKSLSGREAHSLYFQVIPELGIFGILIYGSIIFLLPIKLIKLRSKIPEKDAEHLRVRSLCCILVASMAAYATSGAFISVAYYPHIPIWLVLYSITLKLANEILSESSEASESRDKLV